MPPRYRDSVRAITPGLPLFLYNYSTHQLHGIFEVCTLSLSPPSQVSSGLKIDILKNLDYVRVNKQIVIDGCMYRLQVLVVQTSIQLLGRTRSAPANLVSLPRYHFSVSLYQNSLHIVSTNRLITQEKKKKAIYFIRINHIFYIIHVINLIIVLSLTPYI